MENSDPAKIAIRDSIKIMDKYMRKDEGTRLKYAAKYANHRQLLEKWIGEAKGLKSTHAIEKNKISKQILRKGHKTGKYT